ncbi:N-acetylmuramoyl-L-alanine amidase [Deinococcus metalli]|uniref:N-acetylmuramoyl-L-alanine amidase n=1 Tax=Deinococcus metalli TaxID=1141878 RepID=A0A7W8KFN9_9DEIO|nr:N-acetylmuramoyl-L-alanine amidase [Deinococcus metalli]MBB5377252.1 N-acetylmuramoyl-L-alanine amidase [Deinococcus metalli]GHF47862.1 N-acetylmuramoyl-L-alanine amidase [Deinococcus metalli]
MNGTVLPRLSGLAGRAARPLFLTSLLFAAMAPESAQAAPRVGTHDTYTRLVFDLPKTAPLDVSVTAQSVTVKLGVRLRTEQGPLKAPGVTAYAVSGGTVTVTMASGYAHAKASVLPASGGQGARLIIDVLKGASVASVPVTPARKAVVTRPASTSALRRPRVVLDAGHGGIDPGMASRWVVEKEVTLDVALRTRAELLRHGVDVTMVRTTDTQLSTVKRTDLDERSRLATSGTVAAYVSIHVNSGSSAAQGIETYYFGQPLGGSNRSLAVAENGGGSTGEELTRQAANSAQSALGDILSQAKLSFSRDLARRVQASLVSATGAVNRGVLTDAFYVIKNPTTPAVLVEVGYGSHPTEGQKLATAAYRERLAQGLARAILDFLHTE